MAYTYKNARPTVTADVLLFSTSSEGSASQILLIKRLKEPFKGSWALPGGHVDDGEDLEVAARRELLEETSVNSSNITLTQVGAFGEPGRDPRGWTVTVAYMGLVPTTELGVKAADDAQDAQWFDVKALPDLAFDHRKIIHTALQQLSQKTGSH
eukprot:Colp12_sorted_trinity150504_noHs@4895